MKRRMNLKISINTSSMHITRRTWLTFISLEKVYQVTRAKKPIFNTRMIGLRLLVIIIDANVAPINRKPDNSSSFPHIDRNPDACFENPPGGIS